MVDNLTTTGGTFNDVCTYIERVLSASPGVSPAEYDVPAIADDTSSARAENGAMRWYITDDEEVFWDAVQRHAHIDLDLIITQNSDGTFDAVITAPNDPDQVVDTLDLDTLPKPGTIVSGWEVTQLSSGTGIVTRV